jgi:hypothetical protein
MQREVQLKRALSPDFTDGVGMALQLWSLAKLKVPHAHFCDALMSTISQRALPTPQAHLLPQTGALAGRSSAEPRRAWDLSSSAAEGANPAGDALLGSMEGHELAKTIYSLAVMQRFSATEPRDRAAIDRMVARALQLLPTLTTHSLCNLIW